MAEKPNKTAIGSILLDVAAIITAVVPLLLDDTDKK